MSKADEYRELLDGFIVSTAPADNGDLEAFCPAHENPATSKAPSARINFRPLNKALYPNGMISCFVCNFRGKNARLENIVKIYKQRLEAGVEFDQYKRDTRVHKFASKKNPLPDVETLGEYQEALFANTKALAALKKKRGLNENSIRKFQIGWVGNKQAYCYPVFKEGSFYALRLYRLDPDAEIRHLWYDSDTEHVPQLFGVEGFEDSAEVILLEGEFDAMFAQQDGFNAISHNGGAGKFKSEWVDWFRDKVVYIAYDADAAGRKGRALVASLLKSVTKAVYFIDFPGRKGTDYTDYRVRDGYSIQDFSDLMMSARTRGPESETVSSGLPMTGKRVKISESIDSRYIGMPLEMTVQVVGKMETYSIPSKIAAECTIDKGKICETCPMQKGFAEIEIEKNSDFVQRAIEIKTSELEKMMLREIGAKCRDRITTIGAVRGWTVEPVIVGESVEDQSTDIEDSHSLSSTNMNVTVFNVESSDSRVNDIYRIVGHNVPNPRNQKSMFISWMREATKTNIDQFKMTADLRDQLTIFNPRGDQSAYGKMMHIAIDLSNNVARITGRENLAMALDISWHSVLSFYFNESLEKRGWVELIVLGDTRTGKSETAHKLASWYKNGKVFSTEGATRAGIVAAATQPITGSKSWVVTWGIIPQNDRRLLVLDEAQNLQDIIKEMGSIRSKGVADKVTAGITQSTYARTRLIWLANPVGKAKIHELADGAVTAIQDFMPDAEDRSRFDLAIAASSKDVGYGEISKNVLAKFHRPMYPSEACEQLVLWAWSRQPEQIKMSKDVERYILQQAGVLIEEYGGDFELVQKENMHVKLARITVAIAARLFSTDESGELVVVTRDHVDAAKKFINLAYNDQRFGLGRVSRRAKRDAAQATSNLPEIKEWFRKGHATGMQNYGVEVYRGLKRAGGRFSISDFGMLSSLDPQTAQGLIGDLVDRKLLSMERNARDVVLSAELHDLIREMSEEDDD